MNDDAEIWFLREQLEALENKNPQVLINFVPILNHKYGYKKPEHLRTMTDLLIRAQTEQVFACISMPPRHSKTETLLAAIVWWLLCDPTQQIVYVSHSIPFAEGRLRKLAELMLHAGLVPGDVWRADELTTRQGGRVLARSIDKTIIGEGFDKILIDDPHAGRNEAESVAERENVWQFFTGSAFIRLASRQARPPGGSIFVVHTRWHPDDLIGRLTAMKDVRWHSVNLPAICVDPANDPNGRQMNEPLWPELWPWEDLDIRRRMNLYEWSAQYMGQPRPKGQPIFAEPARYDFAKYEGARLIIGADPAVGEKRTADFSAAVVLAMRGTGVNTEADVLEVYRAQCGVPEFVKQLIRLQRKWGCPIAVESVGGFGAIPQMLREINPELRILPVHPHGDKHARAQPVASAWSDVPGRVRVPADAEAHVWLDDFLDEVRVFTGVKDKHDDQVDALAHAWNTGLQLFEPMALGAISTDWAP